MADTIVPLDIEGAFLVNLKKFEDERGAFLESWRENKYLDWTDGEPLVQQNFSYSMPKVTRGLHYQINNPQGQLVTIVKGAVLDVLVDLRQSSQTYGVVQTVRLNDAVPQQVYMPPGVAHGFQVLGECEAVLNYMCSKYYDHEIERGVVWNDPQLNIPWEYDDPILSPRDSAYPFLKDIDSSELPV